MIVYMMMVNLYNLIRLSSGVKHLIFMSELKNKGFTLTHLIFLDSRILDLT